MKCKKGFKLKDGKCAKMKIPKTKKQIKFIDKWIAIILAFIFSFILFVNNFTQLFSNFGLYVLVQCIAWGGLVFAVFYQWWLAMYRLPPNKLSHMFN